jgi:hypothetical protein
VPNIPAWIKDNKPAIESPLLLAWLRSGTGRASRG